MRFQEMLVYFVNLKSFMIYLSYLWQKSFLLVALGVLNNRNLFSHSSSVFKFKVRVLVKLASPEAFGLKTVVFALCLHMGFHLYICLGPNLLYL
jgi:hypothetical protein